MVPESTRSAQHGIQRTVRGADERSAQLRGAESFTDLLQQVKVTTLEAHAHQDAPFEQLLQVLKPTRDSRYSPLFQVMLVLQDAQDQKGQAAGQVMRLFEATRAWFSFGAEDVWALFHSYAFDFSVWEVQDRRPGALAA